MAQAQKEKEEKFGEIVPLKQEGVIIPNTEIVAIVGTPTYDVRVGFSKRLSIKEIEEIVNNKKKFKEYVEKGIITFAKTPNKLYDFSKEKRKEDEVKLIADLLGTNPLWAKKPVKEIREAKFAEK